MYVGDTANESRMMSELSSRGFAHWDAAQQIERQMLGRFRFAIRRRNAEQQTRPAAWPQAGAAGRSPVASAWLNS